MEEIRIKFETAKLAKEKGFDLEVNAYFNIYGVLNKHYQYGNVSFKDWNNYNEPIGKKGKCYDSAPTQSLIQKWLREMHDIQVIVIPFASDSTNENSNTIYCFFTNKKHFYAFVNKNYEEEFESYEEALEVGLLEGLKLIEVKGEKHSSSKVKTLAAVDTEKLENIQSFVEYAVTESRFNQALENVFPNDEPIENKKLGDVIRWVVNDVIKEEMDTMTDNKIEPKDVNKYISSKVREMFFKLV